MATVRTSKFLIEQTVYTRRELRDAFNINDATINNGIFQPNGHDSLWLFVTENKTPDRVQYNDLLDDDVLQMESQKLGRHDQKMIEHSLNEIEILLFYRKSRSAHPGAGFTYEGRFQYSSHSGSSPATFIFRRE